MSDKLAKVGDSHPDLKLKVGDAVRMTVDRYQGGSGHITAIRTYSTLSPDYEIADVDIDRCFYDKDVEPLGGTMKVGDILVDNEGDEAKVLAYMNQGIELYLFSHWNAFDLGDMWFTVEEIERRGMKVKDDIQIEKSVAEIEKGLKLAPGTLRIKKED